MAAPFLSSDDPFPITGGSESFFSPGALVSTAIDPSPVEPNARKRARTSISPTPDTCSDIQSYDVANKLHSKDPNDIVEALNTLLKLSADHDLNYALGRNGGIVVKRLVEIYDETIGWKHGDLELDEYDEDDDEDDLSDLIPSAKTWKCDASPSNVGARDMDDLEVCSWASFCATKFAPSCLNTAMTPSHITPSNMLSEAKDKDHMKRLESIIMIVRNLSFVQSNVRYLTHTIGMIRILTGSLYFRNFKTGRAERGPKSDRDDSDLGAGNSGNNMCIHAIQALSNLTPMIDTVGRRTFADLNLLDGQLDAAQSQTKAAKTADSLVDVKTLINPEDYGRINPLGFGGIFIAKNFSVRDESFAKIPDSAIHPIVKKYIRAALTMFPPIAGLLGMTSSRVAVVSALDFLNVIIDNSENHPICACISDEVLYQLVRLLWKNRLGPDSLEYLDPVINMVTRVSAIKLVGTYDSTVDYELRDRAIEVLVKLTNLSPELKKRVGKKITSTPTNCYGVSVAKSTNQPNTKLYDAIIPALTSKVGRDSTPLVAAKLLQNLAAVPENRYGIMYLQRKIINTVTTDAGKNPQIANILFNGVLNTIP